MQNFHLLDALESCSELFTRYGGHAHAVGFALPSERVGELRRRLDAYARQRLVPSDLEKVLPFDAELSLDQVNAPLWEGLQQLEPFGMGNPEPIFVARGVRNAETRILKEKHVKLKLVRYGNGTLGPLSRCIEALGWRMAERLEREPINPSDLIDVAFRVERNNHGEFGGALQLVLCDFNVAQHAALAAVAPEASASASSV